MVVLEKEQYRQYYYEEVDNMAFQNASMIIIIMYHRRGKDGGGMAMMENVAYGPVTASQQPLDYILYTQPSMTEVM